ncbi:hypothetical protein BpHYR1_037379 [Brachionus plicatilis]|uniref:Uncharacterized protein n=1 Tax=Brachionus plicatilis TaxID=10195 RepID=A0A3M7S4W3_BRAPC|nr:hypothetical protein BpHYR1_037379 [Brachionus plicatilis]
MIVYANGRNEESFFGCNRKSSKVALVCSGFGDKGYEHDQLVTKFVTKLVGTGLVTTLVIKVYDQF